LHFVSRNGRRWLNLPLCVFLIVWYNTP